jgi:hypothetical protein
MIYWSIHYDRISSLYYVCMKYQGHIYAARSYKYLWQVVRSITEIDNPRSIRFRYY